LTLTDLVLKSLDGDARGGGEDTGDGGQPPGIPDGPGGEDAPNMSGDEAAENGLTERDPNWPWHNLHETEEHHPLMQGDEHRQFWKDRGFTGDQEKFIDNWTETWDKDVHQGARDWWSQNLTRNIVQREAEQGGQPLTPNECVEEAFKLLDEMDKFSP